jgi:hypothetical protein
MDEKALGTGHQFLVVRQSGVSLAKPQSNRYSHQKETDCFSQHNTPLGK